jgi:signal transduction histidine kinase
MEAMNPTGQAGRTGKTARADKVHRLGPLGDLVQWNGLDSNDPDSIGMGTLSQNYRPDSGSQSPAWNGVERRRLEAVVETLAALRGKGESLVELAHDTRNMVTALGLYCDLLEEPGVLTAPYAHYGSELRLVAAASRRLVEKLVNLDGREGSGTAEASSDQEQPTGQVEHTEPSERMEMGEQGKRNLIAGAAGRAAARFRSWALLPAEPIDSLAVELEANRNLLAALAGPQIALTLDARCGCLPVRLTGGDLTRVLVNLVKNAAEAMPSGGRIALVLSERAEKDGSVSGLVLSVEDSGPGIALRAVDRIFESGYSTRIDPRPSRETGSGAWVSGHRGLGLSITRSIVEAAGGRIQVANLAPAGARFEIELPVRSL